MTAITPYVQQSRSWQSHVALRDANRVRQERYRLRREVTRVAAQEGRAAATALLAEAVRTPADWLGGANAGVVLQYAPGVGPQAAGFLLRLADASEGRLLRELSPRQKKVLADGLQAGGRAA